MVGDATNLEELNFSGDSLNSMLSKPETAWVTIAELRKQVGLERNGRDDLMKEKLDVEKERDIAQEERDYFSFRFRR